MEIQEIETIPETEQNAVPLTYGERIKAVRTYLGLQMNTFGKSIYYEPTQIGQIEKGKGDEKSELSKNRMALCIKAVYPQFNLEYLLGTSDTLLENLESSFNPLYEKEMQKILESETVNPSPLTKDDVEKIVKKALIDWDIEKAKTLIQAKHNENLNSSDLYWTEEIHQKD